MDFCRNVKYFGTLDFSYTGPPPNKSSANDFRNNDCPYLHEDNNVPGLTQYRKLSIYLRQCQAGRNMPSGTTFFP